MSKKLLNILSIALIYCGAVFGAGFASGREIFSFFSCYKAGGIVISVFVGFLFSFFGYTVSKYAKMYKIQNADEYFRDLFPKSAAKLFSIIANAFLVLSFCIMITGCGVLFSEQLGTSPLAGVLISLLICFIVIKNDVSGLEKFNLLATPFMLAGVIVLCCVCLALRKVSDVNLDEVVSPAISGLLYISYNMVSAVAVLISAAKIAKTPLQAGVGGAIGGILIFIPLVLMSTVLAYHWEVASQPLPFFALIYENFPKMSVICWVVLYFAMLTTAVSSGVAVVENLSPDKSTKSVYLLCFLALFMSFIPFTTLVQTVYSAFGFIGIVLIAGIIIKKLRNQKKKELNARKSK